MEKGELKKFHSIDGGIESLLSALWEDRKKILFQKEMSGIAKQIDLLQIKASLNFHLSSRLTAMRQDFAKIIYSFFRSYGSKPVFFTGRVDAFGQMREYLIESIKESISQESSSPEFPKEEQKYAIPIGLALGIGSNFPQFRKEEFFPQKNWRLAGKRSLCLLIASLSMALGLIEAVQYAAKSRKEEMVSYLRSTLNEWDLQTIFPNENEEDVLNKWNKIVSSHAREYPYFMQFPKVANVLSWIYQHPLLKEENDPIEITSVHYRLLQCPKMDTPRDPYQGFFEMEFKTKSVLNARKFHEQLLQGDGYVDSSQDVRWESNDNVYHVSFFLKKECKRDS